MGVEQVVGACVTSQFGSIFNSLNALESLARVMGDSFLERETDSKNPLKELGKFTGDLGGPNNKRNKIIHDARFVRKGGIIGRFEIRAKSILQFGMMDESVDELKQFCLDVDRMRREFLATWKRISTELKVLPKSSEQWFPRIVLNDLDQPVRIKRTRVHPRPP